MWMNTLPEVFVVLLVSDDEKGFCRVGEAAVVDFCRLGSES